MINKTTETFVKSIPKEEYFPYEFSICTLVTDRQEYQEMLDSFLQAGFSEACEYLCIENIKENTFDAYAGLNRFLREAKGRYIILCHQDILLHDATRQDLTERISEIDMLDPKWGVLGNAGGINLKHVAMHLTQKNGNKLEEKILPLRALTVDENFIVIKNEANLALSANLKGFHMYGSDICLIADFLGYNAYVIDFNLTHKSDGNADKGFYQIKKQFMRKYRRAYRARFVSTTITRLYLSGNKIKFHLFNSGLIMFLVRQYYKFFKPKKLYHLKRRPHA